MKCPYCRKLVINLDKMKKIYTHPDNVELIKKQFKEQSDKENASLNDHLHFIRWYDFEVISNPHMEKERWTGKWEVLGNEYFSYWDGKGEPPSWCVYFGFVRKLMEPNFYIIDPLFKMFDNNLFAILDNRRVLLGNF